MKKHIFLLHLSFLASAVLNANAPSEVQLKLVRDKQDVYLQSADKKYAMKLLFSYLILKTKNPIWQITADDCNPNFKPTTCTLEDSAWVTFSRLRMVWTHHPNKNRIKGEVLIEHHRPGGFSSSILLDTSNNQHLWLKQFAERDQNQPYFSTTRKFKCEDYSWLKTFPVQNGVYAAELAGIETTVPSAYYPSDENQTIFSFSGLRFDLQNPHQHYLRLYGDDEILNSFNRNKSYFYPFVNFIKYVDHRGNICHVSIPNNLPINRLAEATAHSFYISLSDPLVPKILSFSELTENRPNSESIRFMNLLVSALKDHRKLKEFENAKFLLR